MIWETEPEDFNKKVDVVACYLEHDGKFVLLQRQPHKPHGNQWGLPAGKVDAGETFSQAMKRELFEETGIEVAEEELEFLGSLYVRNGDTDFCYHTFKTVQSERPEVHISPTEHNTFGWYSPEESLGLDLVHDLGDCTKLFYKISRG